MHAALGDILFAFEHDQLWLSPTYHKQADWWQVRLQVARLQHDGTLDYADDLQAAYLRVHPQEEQRVGGAQILTILLRALDPLTSH